MINTKKKNVILNAIIFIILLPMLALSLIIPVTSTKQNTIKSVGAYSITDNSFADTLPNFSSTLYFNQAGHTGYDTVRYLLNFSFRYSALLDSSGATVHTLTINDASNENLTKIVYPITAYNLLYFSDETLVQNLCSVNLNAGNNYFYLVYPFSDLFGSVGFSFSVGLTTNFDCNNIYLFTTGSYKNKNSSYGYNEFIYYSSPTEYLRFRFYCSYLGDSEEAYYFTNSQTYYFVEDLEDNDYYQNGYNSGYDKGYNNGYYYGEKDGYSSGYKQGNTEGYNKGYSKGVEYANDYSFLSLMGAVIDAPITAFTSLLNFELLGVNLLGFVTGLITLALIIFIIKLILGGK